MKSLKQIAKKWTAFGIVLSLLLGFGLVSCASDDDDEDDGKVTVTLVTSSDSKTSYKIESGKTLADISGYSEPVKGVYTFDGWFDANGNQYTSSTQITSSVTLYAKFTKTTTNDDGSTTNETVTTNSSGATVTTTVEKDSSGATTETKVVTEETDGTTTTETTDASGNTTTETTQKTYKDCIKAGLDNLEDADFDSAVANFNKAYSLEANDETRVYSALASLSSISTTSAVSSFFKNHLGIQNYPSTMNALFDESWLEATEYLDYTDDGKIGGITEFNTIDSSSSGNYYSRYYRCSSITPTDSYVSGSTAYKWSIFKKTTINGETIYASLENVAAYEENTTGSTSYNSYYYTYTLDDNGEYYVDSGYVGSSDSSYTLYEASDWTDIPYTYDVKTKFATLSVPTWLKSSPLNNTLSVLLLANILNGNTSGLNSALDDFYSLIFDSAEYSDAISKIDAVSSSVTFSAETVKQLGLEEWFGEDTDVKLGAAELKLIKTAYTALKAAFEYCQSYNLNADLSFLEFDWGSDDAVKEKFEKYLSYDSSVDPLKLNLLGVRNESKMASSKTDLANAITDLITAYDDILSAPSDYPTAFTDTLSEYKILKSGAESLKSAITNGGKFYIPDVETEDELTSLSSWPTSGETYIDFGKIFTAGYLNTSSFLDEDGDEKITIYNLDENYNYDSDDIIYTLKSAYSYNSDDDIDDLVLGVKISLKTIQNLGSGYDDYLTNEDEDSVLPSQIQKDSSGNYYVAVQLNPAAALYIYNFYNQPSGLSDKLKEYAGY